MQGRGKSSTCHLVGGKGKPVGLDLTNPGLKMIRSEIRDALLDPATHVSSEYKLGTMELQGGKSLHDFVRNRSNQVLKAQCQIHHFEAWSVRPVIENLEPMSL